MSMIGYTLHNTLSEHGTVNRGVCSVDESNNLIEVIERVKIAVQDGKGHIILVLMIRVEN